MDAEHLDLSCGKFDQEVMGESFHQSVIAEIVDLDDAAFEAFLLPEPDNKYDSNAIAVMHGSGRALGHLPREQAALVAPTLQALARESPQRLVTCKARLIGGGPLRSRGILLDCDLSSVGGEPPSKARFRSELPADDRTEAESNSANSSYDSLSSAIRSRCVT